MVTLFDYKTSKKFAELGFDEYTTWFYREDGILHNTFEPHHAAELSKKDRVKYIAAVTLEEAIRFLRKNYNIMIRANYCCYSYVPDVVFLAGFSNLREYIPDCMTFDTAEDAEKFAVGHILTTIMKNNAENSSKC